MAKYAHLDPWWRIIRGMGAEADPAYQAYLKALGFDEGLAKQDAARQRTQTNASAELVKPELLAQGFEAREGISDSFEDRGMFNGTERLRGLAGQRRGEQYQLGLIEQQRADALAGIDMALARELSGINKQKINAQQQHDAYIKAQQAAAGEAAFDPVEFAMALVGGGYGTQQPNLPSGYRPTKVIP